MIEIEIDEYNLQKYRPAAHGVGNCLKRLLVNFFCIFSETIVQPICVNYLAII